MPITWLGSPVSWTIGRPDKLEHYHTVLYEIDMLRFTYAKMPLSRPGATEGDLWVYLESFLMHYRNLLEFFGKESSRGTDLTIGRPELIWSAPLDIKRPNENDLSAMHKRGRELWIKYEGTNKRDDTISRYLQHCTTFRTEFKQWNLQEMMDELSGTLDLFERHLPEFKPATKARGCTRTQR